MSGHVLPLEAELPADQGVGERRLSPTHCFPSCGQTLVGYMAAFWKFVFDRDRVGVFDTYSHFSSSRIRDPPLGTGSRVGQTGPQAHCALGCSHLPQRAGTRAQTGACQRVVFVGSVWIKANPRLPSSGIASRVGQEEGHPG